MTEGQLTAEAQVIDTIEARCAAIGPKAGVVLADPTAPRYVAGVAWNTNKQRKRTGWWYTNQRPLAVESREAGIRLAVEDGYTQVDFYLTPDGRVWKC